MKKYDIEFKDVIQLLLDSKWLKGNQFAAGTFIKLDKSGQIVLVDAYNLYKEIPYPFIRSLNTNLYRVITIATVKELQD